jgi:hypothetical protein
MRDNFEASTELEGVPQPAEQSGLGGDGRREGDVHGRHGSNVKTKQCTADDGHRGDDIDIADHVAHVGLGWVGWKRAGRMWDSMEMTQKEEGR